MSATPFERHALEAILPSERERLVRLCARLTGEASAAEDLAQETLLEAWRNLDRLRQVDDTSGVQRWLSAIARNVCLRWARSRGRVSGRIAAPARSADGTAVPLEEQIADDCDLHVELERDELATLLDRALGLLPPLTRAVLIETYVNESPHAETAARLGMQVDAVAQRLHRGRLMLRRVWTTDMRRQAAGYGPNAPALASPGALTATIWQEILSNPACWNETHIWCPFCGARRLQYWHDPEIGCASFRCADCWQLTGTLLPGLLDGLTSPRAMLSRQLVHLTRYYRQGLATGQTTCTACGRRTQVRTHGPSDKPAQFAALVDSRCPEWRTRLGFAVGLHIICPVCGIIEGNPLTHLCVDLPETQRFWRAHPRIRLLPEAEAEVGGVPAIVSTFESVADRARLTIITARHTLEILRIYGAPIMGQIRR